MGIANSNIVLTADRLSPRIDSTETHLRLTTVYISSPVKHGDNRVMERIRCGFRIIPACSSGYETVKERVFFDGCKAQIIDSLHRFVFLLRSESLCCSIDIALRTVRRYTLKISRETKSGVHQGQSRDYRVLHGNSCTCDSYLPSFNIFPLVDR